MGIYATVFLDNLRLSCLLDRTLSADVVKQNKRRFLARKRIHRSRKGRSAPRRRDIKQAQKQSHEAAFRLERDILSLLYMADRPLSDKDIFKELDLARKYRRELPGVLDDLCRRQLLNRHKGSFKLPRKNELVEGILSVNPRGFGFCPALYQGHYWRPIFQPPRFSGALNISSQP